jgi:hypothetical protein
VHKDVGFEQFSVVTINSTTLWVRITQKIVIFNVQKPLFYSAVWHLHLVWVSVSISSDLSDSMHAIYGKHGSR